jgi:hypothetical protein
MWTVMTILGAALAADRPTAGPCDLKTGPGFAAAIGSLDRTDRHLAAAAWLSEACALPPALDAALGELPGVWADARKLIAARAVAADPALLLAACPGEPRAIADYISVEPGSARALLFDRCDLGRHGVIDRATFVSTSYGDPLLFMLAAGAVGPHAAQPDVRTILRALGGAPAATDPLPPVIPRPVGVGP